MPVHLRQDIYTTGRVTAKSLQDTVAPFRMKCETIQSLFQSLQGGNKNGTINKQETPTQG